MKKFMAMLLALLMLLPLVACGGSGEAEEAEETTVRVAALKGPTGMGLVKLMERSEAGETGSNRYEFILAGSADEIVPKLVQGVLDMACVPANLGAVLSNNTDGAVQVLAVNTLGVLYIVENGESVQSVEDLAGRTIYAAGKGSTPEYALQHILDAYQVEAKTEWKSEHAECLAALAADPDGVALLPQPFAAAAMLQNGKIRIALDLNELWAELGDDSTLVTGCIITRRDFVEAHDANVKLFLSQYAESVEFVNGNTDEAAALIEQYGIVKAAVAKAALPYCSIVCVTGEEMKTQLRGYLETLAEQNIAAVGGKLPDEGYYYVG